MATRFSLASIAVIALLIAGWLTTHGLADDAAANKPAANKPAATRSLGGLIALYDFSRVEGDTVRDRSGLGEPLDLKIADLNQVRATDAGLELIRPGKIESTEPATKLSDAIGRSGELAIEVWLRPENTKQNGPARIVSFSRNTSQRNFTLGQEGNQYDARLRTTKTSSNGLPSIASPRRSAETKLTHLVYTRARDGQAAIYINGKPVFEKSVGGDLTNWDQKYSFLIGNEVTGDRPWLGLLRLVAVYQRALSAAEIERNFRAGPVSALPIAADPARAFDTKIAPLLAKHCLECHDSATKRGELDLSRKMAAFAGGASGQAIVPGKAAESLLWTSVESDDMPHDRPPLTDDEKKLLQDWINDGAAWTIEVIDPTLYVPRGQGEQVWLQRLTVPEYIATVKAAVGVDISQEALELLPPDVRADGFSNTAYNLTVDLKHIEAYTKLAEIILKRVDAPEYVSSFVEGKLTEQNQRAAIAEMGKWLFRGPLSQAEVNAFTDVIERVELAGGTREEGLAYVLEAMLQSPRFIYRIERQMGDGTAWPVGPYELASRLSYIIWGAPPDRELMKAADQGALLETNRLRSHVERMLADPRAIERSKLFVHEWLNLGRLANMRPNAKRFPNWNPALAEAMRKETLAFFEEVAWKQRRPMSDLLNAQVTFLTPVLAKHYGLRPQGDGLRRYDLSQVASRGGLLTQGSILTVGGDDASMVSRGLFVLHDVLQGTVKEPPPCVDTSPVPTKEGLTQRLIAEGRIANQACGGCHVKFEPLAFGLEKFDGLGTYHERDEHGNALRDDGEIFFPGASEAVAYENSAELMNLLAESSRVRQCITWKVAQFALGRPLGAADVAAMRAVEQEAWQNGGTYADLMTALVMSDLVRKTRTEINR